MLEINKILVGVEVKPRTGEIPPGSKTAFDQACLLALNTGADLKIVHSLWHSDELWPLSEKGEAALNSLRDEAAGKGVPTSLEVTEERPWMAMCGGAKAGHADLVVVGRRDKEGAESKGRALGAISSKVLRSCCKPVWVVRAGDDLEPKLILAAIDFTKVGMKVLESAAYLARRNNAALHVVHAYRIPRELKQRISELDQEEYDARVEALKAEAQSCVDERLLRVELTEPAKTHLSRKSSSEAIRETVEHLQPDVLIMGSLSKAGRPGFQMGETAERVFGDLECSVLSMKPDDFDCLMD